MKIRDEKVFVVSEVMKEAHTKKTQVKLLKYVQMSSTWA